MGKYKYSLHKDEPDERDYLFCDLIESQNLPLSVDLRDKVIRVYNQLQENSCTANSGCACREMLLQDKSKYLSRQFLYSMERIEEGDINLSEDQGCQMRTIVKVLNTIGICEENYLPYSEETIHTIPSDEAKKNAEQYKINSYHRVNTLEEVKQSLYNQLPVLVGMRVFSEMESDEMAKTGQLKLPMQDSEYLGNHAVLCVGYIDNTINVGLIRNIIGKIINKPTSKGNLIFLNSWGSDWGKSGFFFMPYEYFDKYTIDKWCCVVDK